MVGSVLKQGFFGALKGGISGAIKGFFTAGPAGAAAGGAGGALKGGAEGATKAVDSKSRLSDIVSGKKYEELLGVKEEGNKNQDQPQTEQQTDRKKKTTSKRSHDFIVDPAIFYASTVDFSYDF